MFFKVCEKSETARGSADPPAPGSVKNWSISSRGPESSVGGTDDEGGPDIVFVVHEDGLSTRL